jgi:hypothetical protein
MNRRVALCGIIAAVFLLMLVMFWRQSSSVFFVKLMHPKIKISPEVSMADVRFAEHYVKEAQLVDSNIRAIRITNNRGEKEMEVFVGTMQILTFKNVGKIGWEYTSDVILTP